MCTDRRYEESTYRKSTSEDARCNFLYETTDGLNVCKKRPEPRCAHHAKEALRKAKNAMEAAETSSDSLKLSKARADYDQARWDYFTTPEGQQFLKQKAEQARRDNPEGAAELDRLREKATAARMQQSALSLSLRMSPPLPVHKITSADAEFPEHEVQAMVGIQPVGYIQWNHETGEIKGIDVLPEHRGQGIAQDLIKQAQVASRANGWVSPVKPRDMEDGSDWVAGIHDVPDHSNVEVPQTVASVEPQGWSRERKDEVLHGKIDSFRRDAQFLSDAGYRNVSQSIVVNTCNDMERKLEVFSREVYSDPHLARGQKEEYQSQIHQARRDVQELQFLFTNRERQDRIDNVTSSLRHRLMRLGERIAAD